MQGVYFVLDSFDQLFNILNQDINGAIDQAKTLGELTLIETDKGASKDEWTTC
ncbi:MAG: hypothetical protein K2X50_04975 [Gammaproteobacteria bacterium]|nr:hypothetical protein [Gammaproteobacteria bacterium]